MKKTIFLMAVAIAAAAFGERSLSPGIVAFNASIPFDTKANALFSPLSFELDCCVIAEALDPIGRANVSEKLSVMTDFSGAYDPILDAFDDMTPSNQLMFLSARTIGVSEPHKVNSDFKSRVFEMRSNASISRQWPLRGAERWLKAKLDGWMEDFDMPLAKLGHNEYSFIDATAVAARLMPDAECTQGDANFLAASGETKKLPFMTFRARVNYLRNRDKTVMRVPLRGDAFLYLVMPGEKSTLADLRRSITGGTILSATLEPLDPIQKGIGSAICEISLPKLDMLATTEIENGFGALGIQEKDIIYLYPELNRRTSYQIVRFSLDKGEPSDDVDTLPAAAQKTVFNRPFIFFVYLPEKNVIPVIGQFAGE